MNCFHCSFQVFCPLYAYSVFSPSLRCIHTRAKAVSVMVAHFSCSTWCTRNHVTKPMHSWSFRKPQEECMHLNWKSPRSCKCVCVPGPSKKGNWFVEWNVLLFFVIGAQNSKLRFSRTVCLSGEH